MAKINIYKIANVNDLLLVTGAKSKKNAQDIVEKFLVFLKKRLDPLEVGVIEQKIESNWTDNSAVRAWIETLYELQGYLMGETEVPNSCIIQHLQVDYGESSRIAELMAWQTAGLFMGEGSESISFSFPPPRQLAIRNSGVLVLKNESSSMSGNWKLDWSEGQVPTLHMDSIAEISTQYSWQVHPNLHMAESAVIPYLDLSLTDPRFQDFPIVKNSIFTKNWIKHLNRAYQELAKYSDTAFDMSKKLISSILPLVCGENSIGSASRQEALGMIFLPAVLNQDDQLLECLLHEVMHQYLFRLEECGTLFDKNSPKEEVYFSPWRKDKRPLRMTLHGSFVFTAVADMYLKLALNNDGEMISPEQAQKRAYQRYLEARLALQVIKKYAVLSKFGQYVYKAIEIDLQSISKQISLSEEDKFPIGLALEQHSRKYANYLQ